MSMQAADTSVRTSITVEAPIARAFSMFTDGIGSWWPPENHILQAELAEMVFEPHVGGHIYDRAWTEASRAGRGCWRTSRRAAWCSAGTSIHAGRSRRTRRKPARLRCASPPKAPSGPVSSSSTAISIVTARAGSRCVTPSDRRTGGACSRSPMPWRRPDTATQITSGLPAQSRERARPVKRARSRRQVVATNSRAARPDATRAAAARSASSRARRSSPQARRRRAARSWRSASRVCSQRGHRQTTDGSWPARQSGRGMSDSGSRARRRRVARL